MGIAPYQEKAWAVGIAARHSEGVTIASTAPLNEKKPREPLRNARLCRAGSVGCGL